MGQVYLTLCWSVCRLLLLGLECVLGLHSTWRRVRCVHCVVGRLMAQRWRGCRLVNVAHFLCQHILLLFGIVVLAVMFATYLALVDIGTQCNLNALWTKANQLQFGINFTSQKNTHLPKVIATSAHKVDYRIAWYANQRQGSKHPADAVSPVGICVASIMVRGFLVVNQT